MEYPESARNVTGTHEKRRRWRRAVSVLACAVVFCTTYALILPAITLSAEPKCGLEEHTHTEDCYETRLVCGQVEAPETDPAPAEDPATDPAGSQEAGPAHVHTDACYEQVLTCEKPEHTHTDACWSDPAAAEDPKDWEPQDLTGDWNRDTLAIALAQEGYRPSEDYFTVDDTGEHIGYTRYGDWSGDPFGEWNLSFAAFCLHFAGAAEEAFPAETSAEAWRTALDALDLYQPLEGAIPGDLIFLDSDGDGAADRVGIFTGWQEAEPEDGAASAQPEQRFAVMEGNLDGEAAQAHYDPEDAALLGRASPDEAADAWYLCGEKAHIHGEDCYDETGTLTCGKTEHIHSENCQFPESRSFTYEDEALSLTVTVLTPAPLPEGTELTVTEEDASTLAMEDADTEENGQWLLRGLALTQNGQALEIADCRMTAEVALTERVFAPLAAEAAVLAEDAAPEAEVGVVLSAWQADEDAGLQEVESVLLEEETATLTVPVENGMLALYASSTANPKYTVQYYAYIPRFATSGSNPLTVIDTSSGANAGKATLPQNGVTPTTKNIYLRDTGKTTGSVNNQQKNNGTASKLYAVQTTNELTKMYTENTFEYIKAPNPAYINKLEENGNYQLSQVWILKDGKTADDNTNNWNVYDAGNVHFTNRKDAANASQNIVCITDTTVIRLIYNTSDASFSTGTTFYDYDITNGQNVAGQWMTGITGINSKDNYRNSTNGKRTWDSQCDVLAFGNQNCGTGMGQFQFANGSLNAYNRLNSNANGCTFNLVKGLDNDGNIIYNEWLVTPRLFDEPDEPGKSTAGKTTYDHEENNLTFSRVGDTYTLTSATVKYGNNQSSSITGLENFFNPSPYGNIIYDGVNNTDKKFIATNNFWPMDEIQSGKEPHFGQYRGNPNSDTNYPYAGFASGTNKVGDNETANLPLGDDGRAHNCFFGMHFSLTFTLTADYVGPLDYLFYGDDDMWVFLDGKLVCDIGGVHSSVGEYVNLWDYVSRPAAGEEKTYTLSFFYTERGASGSTCYMNFTLPSVSGTTPQQKSGNLRVEKEVVGLDNGQDFEFKVRFDNRDGTKNLDDFVYDKYNASNSLLGSDLVVHDNGEFTLKAGEYAIIKYLPFGTYYTITEAGTTDYSTSWRGNDGITHSGTVATGCILDGEINRTSVLHFTNTATPNTNLNVKKVEPDGNALSGAAFTLTDSAGNPVKFKAPETADGTYTVYHEELYPEIKDGTEYYIALASNENGKNWVIGQDTSAKKLDAKLQEKTGAAAQRVRIYHQTDGSYSFQSVANGKWLDLDECKTKNGTLVHFWANDNVLTTETAQKWYLLSNGDGTYRIKPKAAVENGSSAVLDMNTGIPSEGQKIQAWTSNNSNAQKWKLVPVNPAEKPETTTTITVSSQGQLFLRDLIPGTYTLTETVAPAYYLGMQPITITVDREGNITLVSNPEGLATVEEGEVALRVVNKPDNVALTLKKIVSGLTTDQKFTFRISYIPQGGGDAVTRTVELAHGQQADPISIPYGAAVTITELNHAGFSVSYKNGEVLLQNGDSYTFTITQDVTITAVNSTGYELPSTGGGGTAWFTLAGLLLMTGAAALTLLRRRAKEGGPE